MANRIVLITGSPRNGNTAAMAYAFEQEAKNLGKEVIRFDAASLYVEGCRACGQCYKVPGIACGLNDDFNRIADAVEDSDAVVFATPLYWYSWPTQIKAVLDRFFAFCNSQAPVAGKSCGLMACCEERDVSAFQALEYSYDQSVAFLGWRSVGKVFVTGVKNPTDYEWTDAAARAKVLAAQI